MSEKKEEQEIGGEGEEESMKDGFYVWKQQELPGYKHRQLLQAGRLSLSERLLFTSTIDDMVQSFATTNKKTKGEYNVESRQRNVNYLRYVSINRGLCNCRTCVVDGRYVDNLYFNNK